MFNFKELKLVKKLSSIKPRLKWLMFSQAQDYKINSNYIDMICPTGEKTSEDYNTKLENIVKETLIKEFTPEIQNMKSYNLLVDAVVHNLKKSQIPTDKE